MQMQIPDDWDGESWSCFRIEWPDSLLYRAMLTGFISQLTRGRFWAADSGIIKDAQSVGWQIFNRNFPYTGCDGEQIQPTTEDILASGGCGCYEIEGWEMPCIDITRLLKIEDGILYAKNDCCEWIAIGTLEGQTEVIKPDVYDPLDPEWSACGKAYAVITQIYNVAASVWDERDNLNFWEWVGHVKADNPGLSLAAGYITEACTGAYALHLALDDVETETTLFDPSTKQSILCALAAQMGDDANVPDNLYEIVVGLFSSEFGIQVFSFAEWFNSCIKAIGQNELKSIAAAGAIDTARDCQCPNALGVGDNPTDPTGRAGWYFSAAESQILNAPGGFNYGTAVFMHTLPYGAYGVAWRVQYQSGDPILVVKRTNDSAPQAGFDVWMFGTNSDDDDGETWYIQCGDTAWSQIGDVLPNSVQRKAFLWSDTLNSPVVDAIDEIALAKINVRAEGDPANCVCNVQIRWLYNANDDSH